MNIGSLLEEIDPYLRLGINHCCLRGQARAWPVLPKAYRPEFAGSANQFVRLADSRLHQWKAEALPYLREMNSVPSSPWEWLAVAQQFGLATKVVDWTSNPLVALFFAIMSHENDDGELLVWNFEPGSYNPSAKPETVSTVVLFRPPPTFARLRFQQGMLSFHPTPEVAIPAQQLFKIAIPAASKIPLQNQLHRCGITHESIFCSLDHLAEKINWISTNHIHRAKLQGARPDR